MKKQLFFCIVFLTQNLVFSQSARLLRFSVVSLDNDTKALVRWTMNAGSTCSDLVVERSGDNKFFNEIYIYPSVCGNSDSAISYSWIDPNPPRNNNLYYRLKLDQIEYSLVSELNFKSKLANNDIIIYPNPNNGYFSTEFSNPNKEKFGFNVYHSDGSIIFSDLGIQGSSYIARINKLNRGVYYLEIQFKNGTRCSAKLFIR